MCPSGRTSPIPILTIIYTTSLPILPLTLGGKSSSLVPHPLSTSPKTNSKTPPSVKNSCPIQFLVYLTPSNVAL